MTDRATWDFGKRSDYLSVPAGPVVVCSLNDAKTRNREYLHLRLQSTIVDVRIEGRVSRLVK